jgi:hypothetical protein
MSHGDHRPDLGAANGIATLDPDALLPEDQLPASVQALLGATKPGEYLGLGSRLDYLGAVVPGDEEIQAIRAYLPQGTYDRMRFFVTNGGGGSTKAVRCAVYNESGGLPSTQLEQTSEVTINGKVNEMVTTALDAPFTLTEAGFYWLAIAVRGVGGTSPKLAGTSNSAFANFLPMTEIATTGTTMPSPFGTGANNGGAVLFRALLDEDAV